MATTWEGDLSPVERYADDYASMGMAEVIRPLARHGAIWVQEWPGGEQPYRTHIDLDRIPDPGERRRLADLLGRMRAVGGFSSALTEVMVAARLLEERPIKVFRPTAAECFALEEVEVSLGVPDYSQPFPLFSVEFPREYQEARRLPTSVDPSRDGGYTATGEVLWHDSEHGMLLGMTLTDLRATVLSSFFGGDRPIEQSITLTCRETAHFINPATEAEYLLSQRSCRVAVNCCLLLMSRGFARVANPAEDWLVRQARQARLRKDAEGAARFSARRRTVPEVYGMEHPVCVRRAVGDPSAASEETPTGRTVRSHWRRSHWRLQRVGKGLAQTRKTLIPHTMVHRERLGPGDEPVAVVYH